MDNDSNYVKEVERYFLSLAGEGIMLSSVDYNLILDWKHKEIPKEVVYKGINRAFVEAKSKDGQGVKSVRALKHCTQYIENSINEFRPIIGNANKGEELEDAKSDLDIAVERLSKYIKSEKEALARSYYINMKEKLLASIEINGNNALGLSSNIEEEAIQELFDSVSQAERLEINTEAQSMLGNRARHMTKAAIDESLISFRNEILAKRYGLVGLLPGEEE